jgi:hypothetical protein
MKHLSVRDLPNKQEAESSTDLHGNSSHPSEKPESTDAWKVKSPLRHQKGLEQAR